ncbi:MAG: alpha/beta fold hydrolase [Oceanospirillaceae bacterium]|nr:alpha/beta fold hydrolase [Oceanospirillaceae bacterium]
MKNNSLPTGQFVRVGNGLELHFNDAGLGLPVIFIHGSGPGASGWSNFKQNYPLFTEAGYRAIVPDLPGYGLSSKPETEYVLDFFVEALFDLVDSLGLERYALVGNSLGGAIAIKMALDRPQQVCRLVLMAPGGLMEKEAYFQQMEGIQKMATAFMGGTLDHEGMRELLKLQLHDPALISDETINERVQVVRTQPKCVLSTMQVPNMASRLHELQCPILGFWGQDDRFCPVSGVATMMQACSRIRFNVLSECGHWVMVEHRDLFNRESIEFLNESRAER